MLAGRIAEIVPRRATAASASLAWPQAMISIRSASDSSGEYSRIGAATIVSASCARRRMIARGMQVRVLISSARVARTLTTASRASWSSVSSVSSVRAKMCALSSRDRPGISRAIFTASSARTSVSASSASRRLVAALAPGLAATAARVAGAPWLAR